MNDIEIEIQVKIERTKPLLIFLRENGRFQGQKRQIDEYFSPPHRDFLAIRPTKEWLRLRSAERKCSINYKNWHYDDKGKSHYCDEYESGIEDIRKFKKILGALNFKSVVAVDKVRKIWTYKDYEIGIDSVRNLGDFIEIEYIGKKKVDADKTTAEMISFLKKIGCGKIERNYVGYPFQLLFKDEVKFEVQ
jgi:adenylate cyclase class 2